MFTYIILALAVGTACAAPASPVATLTEPMDKPAPLANLKPEPPISPAPAPALSTEPSPPSLVVPSAPVSESPMPVAQPSDSRVAKSLYTIPIIETPTTGLKVAPVIIPLVDPPQTRYYLLQQNLKSPIVFPIIPQQREYTVEQYGYHITH